MKAIKFLSLAVLISGLTALSSCKEYSEFDNKEVIENTYSGNIELTGNVEALGDFTGDGDSGTFSFVWENKEKKASVNFDVTTAPGGSCQIILNDAKGNEVFNKTRPEGENDTFSGETKEGKEGKWLVTIKLTNLDGDGTYDIRPAN
ncbi:hypothetical protein SAMN05661096_02291 [Marivirga sericea]|jgi:hypothetical protein|uniref:Lipoprotein n=1 Tax=Marivirga sericea TaxID=1028 RepID=A0A1X7K2F6_9BACT|nr:hypothetical protein [Marivirga sericea]SMG35077.1 hypothetical protein SAMN05661096_02291 [Marivirga sericea]